MRNGVIVDDVNQRIHGTQEDDKREHRGGKRPIETNEHKDKDRVNNPPVGLVTSETDPDAGQKKKTYAYNPHSDRASRDQAAGDDRCVKQAYMKEHGA